MPKDVKETRGARITLYDLCEGTYDGTKLAIADLYLVMFACRASACGTYSVCINHCHEVQKVAFYHIQGGSMLCQDFPSHVSISPSLSSALE